MTGHTYFVAFSVSEICTVVGRSVFGPESRRSLRDTAVAQRDSINFVNDRPALSQECGHLPVARLMGAPIEWLANEKQRPLTWGGLPTGPRTALFAESFLEAQ